MSRFCLICCESTISEEAKNYHPACLRSLFCKINVVTTFAFTKEQYEQDIAPEKLRGMSISGAQTKISIKLDGEKLEPTVTNGEFILKPSPRTYPEAAIVEHLSMRMAHLTGIEVPDSGLFPLKDGELVYLVKRFDRTIGGEKTHHLEDMAQIMNLTKDKEGRYKYESSYEEAISYALEATGRKRKVARDIIHRIVFSYLIANGDLHLKNLSVIKSVNTRSHLYDDLSPGYDFLATSIYFPGEERLAMDVFSAEENNEFSEQYNKYGFHTRFDFIELGKRFEIPVLVIEKMIGQTLEKTEKMKDMILRSPLSQERKSAFIKLIDDRKQALSYTS